MHLRLDADVQKLQEVTTIDENCWAGKDFGAVATRGSIRKKQGRWVGNKILGESSGEGNFRMTDFRNSKPSSRTES
ncbi:hypothetical protein Godav_005318 [Gossypium davidsonii]|uniref:Uncharacterized protein n=1 Tax=Gossypium davidsonii TaxID=34287 RepID=A0A7J8TCK4_GOSDV|nr:hypothetical protein [Gossypium davidsonii]